LEMQLGRLVLQQVMFLTSYEASGPSRQRSRVRVSMVQGQLRTSVVRTKKTIV
jgi:hypothetical protein